MYHVLSLHQHLSEASNYAVGEKCCRAGNDRKIFIEMRQQIMLLTMKKEYMVNTPLLETERLILRKFTEQDMDCVKNSGRKAL